MTNKANSVPSDSIYSVQGVSRRYGDLAALDNVSLEIRRGEWLSIVGPSGSGKSTLMNILGCMDSPTDGIVLLEGDRLDKMGEPELAHVRRNKIGLVFQQFHLVQHLNAVENVELAQYYHSLPDENEALEALARVGMAERATHLPRELSGGEQQRVAVARALANRPIWCSSIPTRLSFWTASPCARNPRIPHLTARGWRAGCWAPGLPASASTERLHDFDPLGRDRLSAR